MKKLFLILALAATSAHANEEWHHISINSGTAFDFKGHSCTNAVNTSGVRVQACLERIRNLQSGNFSFDIAAVDVSECAAGFGTLWTLGFNGETLNKIQVVSGGGSVGSTEFDVLCGLATTST